ncbi:19_t:CDS:2 [Paraglomus occultum]|uniref:19_t:CDS:1 n=1 Tax=Paraglomus occultum TaxID=144539 RepID=A0A9N9C767_9GLOM|nr:19_t:CDS:2 [Paraglomus occultum]
MSANTYPEHKRIDPSGVQKKKPGRKAKVVPPELDLFGNGVVMVVGDKSPPKVEECPECLTQAELDELNTSINEMHELTTAPADPVEENRNSLAERTNEELNRLAIQIHTIIEERMPHPSNS